MIVASILIIDSTGILSTIYRYGTFAYIGGGFGVSVHNILEAAVYGCPTIFGPQHNKANEAIDLIHLKWSNCRIQFQCIKSSYRMLSK
jgi:3-deoxy-D-manno-octulosonic-acid transferase